MAVAVAVVLRMAVYVATATCGATASASSGDGALEPNGRGLQLLGGREAILLEQTEHARQAARLRAVTLYKLLRVVGQEPHITGMAGGAESRGGARAVALATAVLARDLEEARLLRAELERVRSERTALATSAVHRARGPGRADGALLVDASAGTSPSGSCESGCDPTPAAPREPMPAFLRPVSGTLITPFGVGRDRATGAWIFRAAATFGVSAREIVRSPAAGRVVRVADSVAGGVAVVVAIPGASSASSDSPEAVTAPPSRGIAPSRPQNDGDGAGLRELSRARPSPGSTWTVVLSGLDSAAVAPGEDVARGAPLGTAPAGPGAAVRVETWRGRSPVDPAAVLRVRDKR
ncbi:MAG: hypothetical protein ABIS92_18040 [Polyangia bacterium]